VYEAQQKHVYPPAMSCECSVFVQTPIRESILHTKSSAFSLNDFSIINASLLPRMRRHSALSLQATGQATGYKFVRNAAARTAFALTQWKSNMQENSHRVAQSSLDYEKGEVAIANANLRVINDRLTFSYFLCRSNMNKEI